MLSHTPARTALTLTAWVTLAMSWPAQAQSTDTDFPAGATALSGAQLKERLDGKVFDVKLANGVTWRLEYNARGHFFVDVSTGFRSMGKWSAEDGRLCGQLDGRDRSCNEMRLHQDLLHLKRDSGEIVRLVPR